MPILHLRCKARKARIKNTAAALASWQRFQNPEECVDFSRGSHRCASSHKPVMIVSFYEHGIFVVRRGLLAF